MDKEATKEVMKAVEGLLFSLKEMSDEEIDTLRETSPKVFSACFVFSKNISKALEVYA